MRMEMEMEMEMEMKQPVPVDEEEKDIVACFPSRLRWETVEAGRTDEAENEDEDEQNGVQFSMKAPVQMICANLAKQDIRYGTSHALRNQEERGRVLGIAHLSFKK
ncbi:hypothetical protein LTR15_006676 [Elasticomyces elasticus]|nr:hypothetical protein LTR15_006676 [Elasticomyces elasticus]